MVYTKNSSKDCKVEETQIRWVRQGESLESDLNGSGEKEVCSYVPYTVSGAYTYTLYKRYSHMWNSFYHTTVF